MSERFTVWVGNTAYVDEKDLHYQFERAFGRVVKVDKLDKYSFVHFAEKSSQMEAARRGKLYNPDDDECYSYFIIRMPKTSIAQPRSKMETASASTKEASDKEGKKKFAEGGKTNTYSKTKCPHCLGDLNVVLKP